MKHIRTIIKQTPDKIAIKFYFVGSALLFPSILALLGASPLLMFSYVFFENTISVGSKTFTCNRSERNKVNCQYKKTIYLDLITSQKSSLIEVQEARIDKIKESGTKNSYVYNVVVLSKSGNITISSYDGKYASRIVSFLNNKGETSLSIREEYKRWEVLFTAPMMLFFLGLSGLLVYRSLSWTYTLDKTLSRLTLNYPFVSFLDNAKNGESKEYEFHQIAKVEVVEIIADKDKKYYYPTLFLVSGKRVPIRGNFDRETAQELADRIGGFIQ